MIGPNVEMYGYGRHHTEVAVSFWYVVLEPLAHTPPGVSQVTLDCAWMTVDLERGALRTHERDTSDLRTCHWCMATVSIQLYFSNPYISPIANTPARMLCVS